MRNLFRLPLLLITLVFITYCSKDDNEGSITTPDSINQTEWGHDEPDRSYFIYFSVNDEVRLNHPFYDVGSGEFYNEDIYGTFTYDKPNVTFSFTGQCNNNGFVFLECDVTGVINGSTLSIKEDGTTYTFTFIP
ncbi:hypothetical protein ACE939_12385 [Aquimarina sp. W85]|uniref:hypothetical protein n=1 Tax=Aquimarina rhodophyticola TaxID=3342246 RepID=UPI00366CF72E